MDIDISINEYREFVSENPYEEIWRQLYYFTDVDSVNEKIRKRFNLTEKEQRDQPKRRAQKIAYSIIQAHNYFKAASQVDVSVKPNLIYYGISSLANTVIEYNNNGEFSPDCLRDRKQEKHHGLDDKFSLKKDASLQEILESISCIIHIESKKLDESYGLLADVEYDKENMEIKKPYGHFRNFYNSIVPECVLIDAEIHYPNRDSNKLVGRNVIHNADRTNIEDLIVRRFDLLTMFQFLPDVVQQLSSNGIDTNLCHGSMIRHEYLVQQNQSKEDANIQDIYTKALFFIDGLTPEKKEYFGKLYLRNKAIQIKKEYPSNLGFIYDSRQESEDRYFPDMIQDIFRVLYFIYNVEKYIQELANLYICFFCTGMLCRYYPNYWMHWLEKNVGFKHLMETLCSIAIRKFPNLILNQLTQCINHFHL